MAGYIGSKSSVTQVDGYNRTEADGRYVNASGDTMTGTLSVTGGRLYVGQTAGDYVQFGKDTGGNAFIDATQADADFGIYINSTSTGYNKKFGIDSAGRVTMPYQPAFHAMATGASNISSGTLYYGGVTFNTGGHYNSSTSRFTAPVSGVYQFHASCYSQSGTGAQVSAKIAVNGVMRQIGEIAEIGGNFGFDGINMSVIVYLNAGDYVAVEWRAGASIHLNANNNSFSGALIG